MKIIAFSDIHGNQYAFASFIEQIKTLEKDVIFFCGDIHGYYYGQKEVVEQMLQMKNLYAVKGNHDKIAIDVADGVKRAEQFFDQYGHSYARLDKEAVSYVKSLPEVVEFEMEGKKIAILHGTLDDVLEGRLYPKDKVKVEALYKKYDYIFCGHTHFQMVKKCGNASIINAGSAGQQRDGKGFCFAYVDTVTEKVEYKRLYYNRKLLEAEVRKYDPENKKMIEILYRGA